MKANLFYRYFEVGVGKFWRRNSPVISRRCFEPGETPEFDDESCSRHHF
ncbi:hypothetical protein LIZ76_03680 [Caldibacillus sp. 210928-DFI.2.22]|nr:hypothetical protein [Caldibacillus sp. 210928-DFI.2.22]